MRCYGGKHLNGKRIATIIRRIAREAKKKKKTRVYNYVEPFCGAGGVSKHLVKPLEKQGICPYLSDGCPDLVKLWEETSAETFKDPGKITRDQWYALKYAEPSAVRAIAGLAYAFSGVWFTSYLDNAFKNDSYIYNDVMKTGKAMQGARIRHLDYKRAMDGINGRSIIYCDPPYVDTACRFGSSFRFSHKEFNQTITKWKRQGHIVLVSETKCPRGTVLFQTAMRNQMKRNKTRLYRDALFLL